MTVRAILKQKAAEGRGEGVLSVGPDETVADAARVLAEHRVGAVLVCEGDAMRGILSERDIVRALADGTSDVGASKVTGLMTADVQSCDIRDTATGVLERMEAGRFRHMPVMDGDRLAGIVSITDIARRGYRDATQEAERVMEYVGTNARGL